MVSFCWLSSTFSCDSCMVCEPLLCSYKCLFALTFLAERPDYFEGDSGQRSLCIPARSVEPLAMSRSSLGAFPSSHHHFLRLSRIGQGPIPALIGRCAVSLLPTPRSFPSFIIALFLGVCLPPGTLLRVYFWETSCAFSLRSADCSFGLLV